jgi:RimJ/RimL family protein N-acetyltransferase
MGIVPFSGGGVMKAIDLSGERVRLAIFDLEKDSQAMARWGADSEYMRLLSSGPNSVFSAESFRSSMEKEFSENEVLLSIRLLSEDVSIGFVDLNGFNWAARSAWVAIGIGEPDYRGKGYGTEAMNLLARYAFRQLNLNRINLSVYEYNPRAMRSYVKCGFIEEGRERQWLDRGGRRWDLIFMGLLREDWLARQTEK